MDLSHTMELAGRNLLNCLSPAMNFHPYWAMRMDVDYRGEMVFFGNIHNLGRWWDAMLRLEAATGFEIPAHLEAAMLANLRESFDNPDHLCLPAFDHPWLKPALDFHSLRESLLALNALVRFRGSRWARGQARLMLETLARITRDDATWDVAALDYYRRLAQPGVTVEPDVSNHGRLIEALVWFYQATGEPLAYELADRYARFHLAHTVSADGRFPASSTAKHTHSYLGTLRGLWLWGVLTGQREYLQRVADTYRVTVPQAVLESGFACHDLWKDDPGRGEVGSTSDATQLALWIARDGGATELLDDVERLVRARLVPAQITGSPPIRAADEERAGQGADEFARLDERIIGAIGGMQREPHAGKKHTTDVTAAALHCLTDVYGHVVEHTRADVTVRLHFDWEDERVQVRSVRSDPAEGDVACVTVRPRVAANVRIRVPRWAPRESLRLTVGGEPAALRLVGDFAFVPSGGPAPVELRYALPRRTSHERVGEMEVEYHWRGDEIIGVTPQSDFFPMYPAA